VRALENVLGICDAAPSYHNRSGIVYVCITSMQRATIGLMKAITVRNIPPHVARLIERKARQDKTSLNRAVVSLLEQGSSVRENGKRTVHRDLDFLFGSWTKEEADAFDADLAEQRKIDPELWK
jgi:hypothetical protein